MANSWLLQLLFPSVHDTISVLEERLAQATRGRHMTAVALKRLVDSHDPHINPAATLLVSVEEANALAYAEKALKQCGLHKNLLNWEVSRVRDDLYNHRGGMDEAGSTPVTPN